MWYNISNFMAKFIIKTEKGGTIEYDADLVEEISVTIDGEPFIISIKHGNR